MTPETTSSRMGALGRFVLKYSLAIGAGMVLLISFVCRVSNLPGFTICWFKRNTGLPCPGCGLTRAFCSISHGEWGNAWGYNPFSFPFYAIAVGLVVIPILRGTGVMTEGMETRLNKVMAIAGPIIAVLMLVYGVCRILALSHLPARAG